MFGSITLGVTVGFLTLLLSQKFFEEKLELGMKRALIVGVGVIIINFTTIKAPAVLAVLFLPVMITMMIYMIGWWAEEGTTFKQLIMFVAIDLILALVLNNTAMRVRDIVRIKWLTAITDCVFAVAMILSVGFMLAEMIWFQEAISDEDASGKEVGK